LRLFVSRCIYDYAGSCIVILRYFYILLSYINAWRKITQWKERNVSVEPIR